MTLWPCSRGLLLYWVWRLTACVSTRNLATSSTTFNLPYGIFLLISILRTLYVSIHFSFRIHPVRRALNSFVLWWSKSSCKKYWVENNANQYENGYNQFFSYSIWLKTDRFSFSSILSDRGSALLIQSTKTQISQQGYQSAFQPHAWFSHLCTSQKPLNIHVWCCLTLLAVPRTCTCLSIRELGKHTTTKE